MCSAVVEGKDEGRGRRRTFASAVMRRVPAEQVKTFRGGPRGGLVRVQMLHVKDQHPSVI